jgi:glycerophosphoryl diester phosphodiesterase
MIHNIAHRGASAYEPENTLPAFERAIEMGATMLELDVRLSRDGQPVVIHDEDFSRLAGDVRAVKYLTLEQIKSIDVGRGKRVPTLHEVTRHVRGRAELYVELKGQRTPAPVVAALQRMNCVDGAIVGSFFPWLPQRVKFLDPRVRTSILVRGEDRNEDFIAWAKAVEADFVHLCWERASRTPHALLSPQLLDSIRERGLGIILWHEERPAELRELVRMNVDGICTNTPDVLAALLDSRSRERFPCQDRR